MHKSKTNLDRERNEGRIGGYECGYIIRHVGVLGIVDRRFMIRYYIIGVMYLIFDIELGVVLLVLMER